MTMIERVEPPQVGDERALLTGYLDYQRATLAMKCEGLAPEQLVERSAAPSTLSLLGLVRHLAEVERVWFRRRIAHEDVPYLHFTEEAPDADFDNLSPDGVDEAMATWREECDHARRIAAERSLDDEGVRGDGSAVSLRWVLLHMIEEYARHNGHADLLRERIDGAVGE